MKMQRAVQRLRDLFGHFRSTEPIAANKPKIRIEDLERVLEQAVANGDIPHAVVYATNGDGSFQYSYSTGWRNLNDTSVPIGDDAVFSLASSTKLLATIAVLRAVDQGLLRLDDDVAEQLPELASQPILRGYDADDKPILVQRTKPITLRLLLTHSAGASYDSGHPLLIRWQQEHGRQLSSGTTPIERFSLPLIYEPGESFLYSPGIDWAGLMVERATGKSLEEYMRTEMWEPLGLNSLTFWANRDENLKPRIPGITVRAGEVDGPLSVNTERTIYTGVTGCFGGHGMYGTMADYAAVLRSILANDGKLLKLETVNSMFTQQLGKASHNALAAFRSSPFGAMVIGDNPPEYAADWGLGGLLFLQEHTGRRKPNTLSWGGMMNTFWIIDREADLALTFGTQVLPPGDERVSQAIKAVELAVYEKAGVKF